MKTALQILKTSPASVTLTSRLITGPVVADKLGEI